MRAQCERLLEVGQWPHVAIQVLPDANEAACAYGKDFMILTFHGSGKKATAADGVSGGYADRAICP
jgi:hypothetical protein